MIPLQIWLLSHLTGMDMMLLMVGLSVEAVRQIGHFGIRTEWSRDE